MNYQCDKFQPDGDWCLYHIDREQTPALCRLPSMFLCEGFMQQDLLHGPPPPPTNSPASVDQDTVEAPADPKAHLSHSQVQDFLRCRRRYYHKHIQHVEPIDCQYGTALKMGILWDIAVQVRFGSGVMQDLQQAIDRYDIDEYSVAKVQGVYKAYRELVDIETDSAACQVEVSRILDGVLVTGIYDRVYGDYFVECKFTSRPENYTDVFTLTSQIGTYFLLDDRMQRCVMEIVRAPQLRYKDDDDPQDFRDRVYKDVINRPAFYFHGYTRKHRRFGVTFHRGEFDLDQLQARYSRVRQEINQSVQAGEPAFYIQEPGCIAYGEMCEYHHICKTGVISTTKYHVKEAK